MSDQEKFWKPSPFERRWLAERLSALYRQGYTGIEIAASFGMSPATALDYVRDGGVKVVKNRDRARREPPLPSLESHRDWRQEAREAAREAARGDRRSVKPLYQRSSTLHIINGMLLGLADGNAVNRFANDVQEAVDAADEQWRARADDALREAADYLTRLRTVLVDANARSRARLDPGERDDTAQLFVVRS